ncbi:SP_1767 family glycosyltransferase [Streptococcus suis]
MTAICKYFKILPIDQTLTYILNNGSSVARFGDGEIEIIAGNSIPYQPYHPDLAKELRHIMGLSSSPQFIVCLSDVFEGQERYNRFSMDFWRGHLHHYEQLYKDICHADWYGSTFISRPYMDLIDKSVSEGYFAQLKKLWNEKNILIVEGQTSRSGVGNDLFVNARSIERIICPAQDAYKDIQWIESAIRQYGTGKLVLLMLGPTAKVISYHLSQEGYHTIDLGHIDSEYEWFQMGATEKVPLKHKHTAEFNYDTQVVLEEDEWYEHQIVCRIDDYKKDMIATKPLISIIVPVYNVQSYLEECLDSICRQTYQNIEILLINDGSTDRSPAICEEYATRDKRIEIIHQENAGASVARNKGIDQAKGTYILFVDSDDIIHDNLISELYHYVTLTNADISMGQYYLYQESDGMFYYYPMDDKIDFEIVEPSEAIIRQANWGIYNTANYIVVYNKLIRKELFENIRFPEKIRFEDEGILHRLFLRAKTIVQVNQITYLYRIRHNSVMTSAFDLSKVRELLQVFDQKISDLVLAGVDINDMRMRYFNLLHDSEKIMSASNLTDTPEYKEVVFKLSLKK